MVFVRATDRVFGSYDDTLTGYFLINYFVFLKERQQKQYSQLGHGGDVSVHARVGAYRAYIFSLGNDVEIVTTDLKRQALGYPGTDSTLRLIIMQGLTPPLLFRPVLRFFPRPS